MYVKLNVPFFCSVNRGGCRKGRIQRLNGRMERTERPLGFPFSQTCGSILNDVNDLIDRSCGPCTELVDGASSYRCLSREPRDECERCIPIGSITSTKFSAKTSRKKERKTLSDGLWKWCFFVLLLFSWKWWGGLNKEGRRCGIMESVKDLDLFALHYMNWEKKNSCTLLFGRCQWDVNTRERHLSL